MPERIPLRAGLSIVILACLVSSGVCQVSQARDAVAENLILITVDTLRADRLRCYGYRQIQTPHIDRLAAEGARFTTVVAQAPLTLPSVCTILTGTYPWFHGVRDNVGYQLGGSKTTLAEILKKYGYTTGGFVGTYVLDSRFGVSQGFDFYFDDFDTDDSKAFINMNRLEWRAQDVVGQAIRWLDDLSYDQGRFFAWVHLYDPHDPYDPPGPFKAAYGPRPYDGEIAYVDQEIGRLLKFLERQQLYDKTVIVLTGDHGESFGEHGEFRHGFFIYDSTLLVPLIIKPASSSFQNHVISKQVRTVDIAPTILQLLRLPKAAEIQGVGLLGVMLGKQADFQVDAYSETFYPAQFGWSSLRSLRTRTHKYIDAPRPELFNLTDDLAELHNIYGDNKALAGQMRSQLDDLERMFAEKSASAQSQALLSPGEIEKIEKLRALGYLGGPIRVTRARARAKGLADPKDKLDIFYSLSKAAQNAAREQCDVAINQLSKVVELEPQLEAARLLLGRCYFEKQQFDLALQEFRRLLDLNSEHIEARFHAAVCEFNLGELDSAERGFARVITADPNHALAHKHLGFIYEAKGKIGQALLAFERVIERAPKDLEAHGKLGFLLAQQSRIAEATPHFEKVVELDPENASAYHNLGLAYLKQNLRSLAARAFARACELDSGFCRE